MAYSEKKAKEIKKLALELGVNKAAKKLKMSAESVKRAIRIADKTNKEIKYVPKTQVYGDSRVLVIGDLHSPFDLDSYFGHCVDVAAKYRVNKVVFIGDVIDNHFSSYHETDPDGMGAGDELDIAINRLKRWYDAFPEATVLIGNHDRLVSRKAMTAGISKRWVRDYNEVLECPNWNFTERTVIDNVQYIHGEAGTARTKCRGDLMNTVQGHLHTQAYIEHYVGANFNVFGMQVGCGIDHEAYAMAYAKAGKKPAISCGVVIDGTLPILEMAAL